ncbi:MAG: nuclear transport factor 2 family protein [Gammaproteobacteria bacterium]|nr:nuclear transport factor 2 family protein [Gammaproteobacteria bacterium]
MKFFKQFLLGLALIGCAQTAVASLLQDELAVLRIPTEIETAVDAKDWGRARSHFADEVAVDFSSLSGQPPATIPSDDLIGGWAANLGPAKQSHHQRGHGLVQIDGDYATVYSQGYAWNKMEGNGNPLWEVWGNYTHTLVRTADGWKVTGFTFEMTHERGNSWVRDTPSPAE